MARKETLSRANLAKYREQFIKLKDPVGFKFAQANNLPFSEFEKLIQMKWFKPHWESWQKELRAQIKAEALERIAEISQEGSAQSLNASKYLANGEYLEEGTTKRGRPTTEQVKGELKRKVEEVQALNTDYHRMVGTLQVIDGGRANIKS